MQRNVKKKKMKSALEGDNRRGTKKMLKNNKREFTGITRGKNSLKNPKKKTKQKSDTELNEKILARNAEINS